MSTSGAKVTELIGVYHADGGMVGEAKYLLGKILGTAHCALCDVTHSPMHRKPQWDAMVARLGIPVTLLHLNEQPADVAAATKGVGTPVVLARMESGSLQVALTPAELDQLRGSVHDFESAVINSMHRNGWRLD